MEAKLHSSSHLDIPSDLATHFQNIKEHISGSTKQVSKSLSEDVRKILSQNNEVSLLLEETQIKNKEISSFSQSDSNTT